MKTILIIEDDRDIRTLLERAIGQYLDDAFGRELYAYRIPVEGGRDFALFRRRPLRLVVSLTSGGFLVIETADELTARVIGLPPGFWAGIAGFVVAALALLPVVRETRPLARLARSVERFGTAAEPVPLPEHGAATDTIDLVALVRRECAERMPAEKARAGPMPP